MQISTNIRKQKYWGYIIFNHKELTNKFQSILLKGSGTLCLLGLNKYNNMMFSMNIGDSGFRLIRNGSIVHKSKGISNHQNESWWCYFK